MKKFMVVLLTVVVATALTNKVTAQYSIPSFDVPVIADPTTFEEMPLENVVGFGNVVHGIEPVIIETGTREERIMRVDATDKDVATTAWSNIVIYSLDNTINYGPYTVYEGNNFEINLSTDYEWGLRVVDASQGCEMSVWYD
jgi:hypothetical protein